MSTMFVRIVKAVARGGVKLAVGAIMLVVGKSGDGLVRATNSKGEVVDLHESEYVEVKRKDQ